MAEADLAGRRDPRRDPRPGDQVRLYRVERAECIWAVRKVAGEWIHVCEYLGRPGGRQWTLGRTPRFRLEEWRERVRHADVMRIADA